MTRDEIVTALREHAEQSVGNEWGSSIIGLTMATVKCALGKRGRPSHEWNDGKKDRIYCLGRVDPMTDDPLPECLDCPDFVNKAQDGSRGERKDDADV